MLQINPQLLFQSVISDEQADTKNMTHPYVGTQVSSLIRMVHTGISSEYSLRLSSRLMGHFLHAIGQKKRVCEGTYPVCPS
jgi:hypothetical protein